MKGSVLAIAMFAIGIAVAHFGIVPEYFVAHAQDFALYTLYGLIALIGFEFGHDAMVDNLKKIDSAMLFLPLFSVVGTLAATLAIGAVVGKWTFTEYMAVGSGMGYYSLSSLLILSMKSGVLGTALATQLAMLAFLTNMSRELTAIVGAPFFRRCFGRYAPVAAGGVTSIDVTLPVIISVSGQQTMVVSVVHGIILELTVPLLVTFFCSI